MKLNDSWRNIFETRLAVQSGLLDSMFLGSEVAFFNVLSLVLTNLALVWPVCQ